MSPTNTALIFTSALVMLFLNLGQYAIASPLYRPAKCPVCTDADRAKCPVVEEGPNCEAIEEPNCGCCKMCAKKVGENCGVATGLCETGLECIPPPMTAEEYRDYGPANYFMEAVMGEFICVTRQQFLDILTGVAYEDEAPVENGVYIPELYDLEGNGEAENTVENQGTHNDGQTSDAGDPGPGVVQPQLEAVYEVERPAEPPTPPFENSPEPCIYHADKVWGKEHFDHHEWIPSCEKDGYYFPEQCELSFGLERGRCWCVDRLGNAVSKFVDGDEASPERCLPEFNKT